MLLMMIFGSTGMRVGVPIAAVLGMIVGYFILPSVFHPSEHNASFDEALFDKQITKVDRLEEQANAQKTATEVAAEAVLQKATADFNKKITDAAARAETARTQAEAAREAQNRLLQTKLEGLTIQLANMQGKLPPANKPP